MAPPLAPAGDHGPPQAPAGSAQPETPAKRLRLAEDLDGSGARANAHQTWVENHPVICTTPAHLRIPLGCHGDGAGSTMGEKVFVVTWGGVATAATLPTVDSRLLFSCLRDSEIVPNQSLRKLFKVLAWSFQAGTCNARGFACHAPAAPSCSPLPPLPTP
jgi:hypothetical protein